MEWMRIKKFCATYGIPESVINRAVHSDYQRQIARKANPDAVNSPWMVNVKQTLKLWKEGFI